MEKKMSSYADRPTVGQLIADTQEKASNAAPVEAGDLAEGLGKDFVMKEVWRQIDDRRSLPQWNDKFYIVVFFRKDPFIKRTIRCDVQCRHTEPKREPGLTCFSYEGGKDDLLLEWVLPTRASFPMFLKNRANTDEFLIHCIESFLEDEAMPYEKV